MDKYVKSIERVKFVSWLSRNWNDFLVIRWKKGGGNNLESRRHTLYFWKRPRYRSTPIQTRRFPVPNITAHTFHRSPSILCMIHHKWTIKGIQFNRSSLLLTPTLVSINCLRREPMMMRKSLTMIMMYQRLRNSNWSLNSNFSFISFSKKTIVSWNVRSLFFSHMIFQIKKKNSFTSHYLCRWWTHTFQLLCSYNGTYAENEGTEAEKHNDNVQNGSSNFCFNSMIWGYKNFHTWLHLVSPTFILFWEKNLHSITMAP